MRLRFKPTPPDLFVTFGRTAFKPESVLIATGDERTEVWREIDRGIGRNNDIVHDVVDVPFATFVKLAEGLDGSEILPGIWIANDHWGADVTIGPESDSGTFLRRWGHVFPLPCTTAQLAAAFNEQELAIHKAEVDKWERRTPKRGPNGRFVAR